MMEEIKITRQAKRNINSDLYQKDSELVGLEEELVQFWNKPIAMEIEIFIRLK